MNFYNRSNYKENELPEHIEELVYELEGMFDDSFCCTLHNDVIKLSSDNIGDLNRVLFQQEQRRQPITCEMIDGKRYYFTSIPVPAQ
jgi:hypothetical protein